MKTVLVIVPTYNEAENIESLINYADKYLKKAMYTPRFLIVDDLSPDKTGDIVRKLSKNNPNIHLLSGEKQGLGKAYVRGFKYALNNLNFDYVCVMSDVMRI